MEKVLRLPVNEYWYNLIITGEITCDYRDVKPYWIKRLENKTYDFVEFYHRFNKDIKPIRYKFEWIDRGRLLHIDKEVYLIKFK